MPSGWTVNELPLGGDARTSPLTSQATSPFRMNAVTVEIPATTSNLGPGYDCLGVALGLVEPRDGHDGDR